MEKIKPSAESFPVARSERLLYPQEAPVSTFPIAQITIDWDRLKAKRPLVLETIDAMPAYLIKPKVLALLEQEKDPTYRLIMDLMWTTGARVSEVLALTPASFKADAWDFGVVLKTLKQRPGRPSRAALARVLPRFHGRL